MSEPKNFLEMSDEEMLNAPLPELTADGADDQPAAGQGDAADADQQQEQAADAAAGDEAPVGDEEAGQAEANKNDQGDDADDQAADQAAKGAKDPMAEDGKPGKQAQQADPKKEAKTEAETKPQGDVDYKAAYERLMAPFKANGRDIQARSVEDAISLMQMGANYNKKMAGLKPSLKILKMLENNGLLSEERVSFLIDLEKKNPEAINKLVKDSGLDPLDLGAEKADAYQPKNHTVDDRELELDAVLEELKGSNEYAKTLSIVTTDWDKASKEVIANSPQLLKVIHGHVANGIYDLISTEVENERLFGRLAGLSDIEAYRQVGDAINARGGFNHLGSSQKETSGAKVVTPKPKKVEDDTLKDKRRAAAPVKAASSSVQKEFNPLALSDADFAKMAAPVAG